MDDLFQVDISKGEKIYTCHICDEGFENSDNVRVLIADKHKKIMLSMKKLRKTKMTAKKLKVAVRIACGEMWASEFVTICKINDDLEL